ncbi:MAG: ABC transporter permease subunit [Spirochaetales bacterium]|nr:ABC transporter permease subunit [Spirochaetales bacterium]
MLIILSLWIAVTTVRKPLSRIDIDDFERAIVGNLYDEQDILLINESYYKNSSGDQYLLKKNLSPRQHIEIREVISYTGFKYEEERIPNPVLSQNVLPHPVDILRSFPSLIRGTNDSSEKFQWRKSLIYAIWISLRRELTAFFFVVLFALPLGVLMSCFKAFRSFMNPALIVGTFIPIAALIPLTMAFFGIGEQQKIIFLVLSMFFVLLGLVIKEIDEVDDILLSTGYTLGFSQVKTIVLIVVPSALSRIWKHFAAVFGLGWGYIIFAEMINSGGGDSINGLGWLFIARQRRFKVDEMYAIFFVIILFAFIFSYLFKLGHYLIFKHDRGQRNGK